MLIWLWFFVGQFLHLFKRYDLITKSPKNEVYSLNQFAKTYGVQTITQLAIAAACFQILKSNPEFAQWLVGKVYVLIHIENSAPVLPITSGVGFLLGYTSDGLLDWLFEKFPSVRKLFNSTSTS